MISRKISFGEKSYKYFISYLCDNHKVKPIHIILPKPSAYVKSYDEQTKWTHFLIEDDDLLAKYNTIWNKVSAGIKEELDIGPVYNKEFFKTKIKSQGDEVQTFTMKKFQRWTLIILLV